RLFEGRGLTVQRYDLPYRQARPKGPPRPHEAARDRAGLREAVEAMRHRATGRLWLGGQSYGGRQASILAAGEAGLVDALLLLSYPLHPPSKSGERRTAHFPELRTPALFVHGSADPFGTLDEVEAARARIPARPPRGPGTRWAATGGPPSGRARSRCSVAPARSQACGATFTPSGLRSSAFHSQSVSTRTGKVTAARGARRS